MKSNFLSCFEHQFFSNSLLVDSSRDKKKCDQIIYSIATTVIYRMLRRYCDFLASRTDLIAYVSCHGILRCRLAATDVETAIVVLRIALYLSPPLFEIRTSNVLCDFNNESREQTNCSTFPFFALRRLFISIPIGKRTEKKIERGDLAHEKTIFFH